MISFVLLRHYWSSSTPERPSPRHTSACSAPLCCLCIFPRLITELSLDECLRSCPAQHNSYSDPILQDCEWPILLLDTNSDMHGNPTYTYLLTPGYVIVLNYTIHQWFYLAVKNMYPDGSLSDFTLN